jgi:hypothetical protein
MPPSEKAVKEAIEIVKKELESPEMEEAIFGELPDGVEPKGTDSYMFGGEGDDGTA